MIKGINESGRNICLEVLKDIVNTDKKGRYPFNEDFTKIRANQGHSVNVNVQMKELNPPQFLYHGNSDKK